MQSLDPTAPPSRAAKNVRRARVIGLLIALWTAPAAAYAVDPAAAEGHFTRGRALMRQGALDGACAELRQSQLLDPGVGTLLNLAECEERRGRLATAWSLWLQAATEAASQSQWERGALARGRAAALTPRLGTLTVVVSPKATLEGLRIESDGALLDRGTWGRELPVDPGQHALTASAPGYRDWAVSLTTSAGVNVRVEVPTLAADGSLSPATPDEPATGWITRPAVLLSIAGLSMLLLLAMWILRSRDALAKGLLSSRPLPLLVFAGVFSGVIGGLGYLSQGSGSRPRGPAQTAGASTKREALEVVRVAGDPWSGYSTFRGESRLKQALAHKGIALEYLDEAELYDQDTRMQALADGRIHLALTTVDAFLQHGAKHREGGRYPGVIVWNIDESDGGDAIFLAKGRTGFDSVQATDRVCYAAGTPSEHLWDFASLSFAHLDGRLSKDNGVVASDCWKKLEAGQVQIAVLWQPSTAIAVKAGYPQVFATGGQADDVIVDVMVANREYLASHRATVTELGRAYFETIAWLVAHPDEHADFITRDCGPDCGNDVELGRAVLKGIDFLTYEENSCLWWGQCGKPAKMEERVQKTGQLLAAKGKIPEHELPQPSSILDNGCLTAIAPAPPATPAGVAPERAVLALHEEAREKRYSYDASATTHGDDGDVGTLRLPSIYFPEASAELDQNAESVVRIIADRLRAFPALCVRIHGHTNSAGNAASNFLLSEGRARAIAGELTRLDPEAFPPSRFDVRGLGATAPVLHDNKAENFAASRRTEFKLFRCQLGPAPAERR